MLVTSLAGEQRMKVSGGGDESDEMRDILLVLSPDSWGFIAFDVT